jgi:hypothetical protein
MNTTHTKRLRQIEAAIAEALMRIERQRQMIADFQSRGYDVRAPLTLLACLLVNLRRLEDKRREELRTQIGAADAAQRAGGTIAHPTSSGVLLCK